MLLNRRIKLVFMLIVGGFSIMHNSLAQTSAASGNGPYAAPLAASYADLTNAAHKIVSAANLNGKLVVIYDQQVFSTFSVYQVAVDQLRLAMRSLCPSAGPHAELVPSLDIGGAASGLAALITALTPGYAIQGQAVSFDNTALIAAFAQQVNGAVIFPGYLMPSAKKNTLTCGSYPSSVSIADLWYAAIAEAAVRASEAAAMPEQNDTQKAQKKALQDKVDKFQKTADTFVAIDKGPSALSKLLIVESLLDQIQGHFPASVIDLRLDAAGNDTSTKTFLWWKWTKFNSTVMAHYTLLSISYDGSRIDLHPVQTNSVTILSRVPSEDKFGTSEQPAGAINGVNKPPTH